MPQDNSKSDINNPQNPTSQPFSSATSSNQQSSDKDLQSSYQMQDQAASSKENNTVQASAEMQRKTTPKPQTRSISGQAMGQAVQGQQQQTATDPIQQQSVTQPQGASPPASRQQAQSTQTTRSNQSAATQDQTAAQPKPVVKQQQTTQTQQTQTDQPVQQPQQQPAAQPAQQVQQPVQQAQPSQAPASNTAQPQQQVQPQSIDQPTTQPAQPVQQQKPAKKKANKKSLLSSLLPGSGGKENGKKSAKSATSTQKFLKIKGIRDGILELEDGSFKAILMASSVNFSLMSGDEQKAMLYGYQEFLNSLEFPIQIVVQSRIININNYLEKLQEAERMQENDLLKIQISEYREYIKSLVELANITTNRYYVVISYTGSGGSSSKESIGDRVKSFINPAREAKVDIESYDKAMQELNLRVSRVAQGLRSMGIRAANLNTQEVVELFYTIYNPELSGSQVLAELERLNIET